MTNQSPAPVAGADRLVFTVEPGSREHFWLLMAPYHLQSVTGKDAEHLQAFARDVWLAARSAPAVAEKVPLTEALNEERRKFQQETLRTSELTALLRKWVERHENEHGAGPWQRGCELCALVDASQKLMARPINAPPTVGSGSAQEGQAK